MPRKDKKETYNFSDDYKNAYKELSLKLRVKVNMTAGELLEVQRKDEALSRSMGELALDEGKRKNQDNQ